jgi:hypothetical protein
VTLLPTKFTLFLRKKLELKTNFFQSPLVPSNVVKVLVTWYSTAYFQIYAINPTLCGYEECTATYGLTSDSSPALNCNLITDAPQYGTSHIYVTGYHKLFFWDLLFQEISRVLQLQI